jgi:type IV secretory pathway VirB4 component
VLLDALGRVEFDAATEREMYQQIENVYALDSSQRTLGVLANTLRQDLSARLAKWVRGGPFGFVFDNEDDTMSFSRF